MKHLKSSLKDLRKIFERSITVRDIAEPLASFDVCCLVDDVKKFMDAKDFDVIGVRKNGLSAGYAKKSEMSSGKLEDYFIYFKESEIFSEDTSLIEVLEAFQSLERIFVLVFGQVSGILTRGDFQKIPVRMWLFGLISLLEMNLLRIIREYYPQNGWNNLIKFKRLEKAKNKFDDLRKENVAIDLVDCLEFCDKREILIKSKDILNGLCVSKNICNKFLTRLETLRNKIAHAGNIDTKKLPEIIELASNAEEFLRKCEEFENK